MARQQKIARYWQQRGAQTARQAQQPRVVLGGQKERASGLRPRQQQGAKEGAKGGLQQLGQSQGRQAARPQQLNESRMMCKQWQGGRQFQALLVQAQLAQQQAQA